MSSVFKILKVSFFVFLDITGILLGVFLASLGLAVLFGWRVTEWMSWLLLIIGTCAFFIHLGHYFNLRYMRWLFGDEYFIQK